MIGIILFIVGGVAFLLTKSTINEISFINQIGV